MVCGCPGCGFVLLALIAEIVGQRRPVKDDGLHLETRKMRCRL